MKASWPGPLAWLAKAFVAFVAVDETQRREASVTQLHADSTSPKATSERKAA